MVETGGLENHCTVGSPAANRLEIKEQLGINPRDSADCSKTVVVGEVAERLMAPVLKTGIP